MSQSFTITITMSGTSVATLAEGGFRLCGFRAVQGPPGALPVLWFVADFYSLTTTLRWMDAYEAYTSHTVLLPDTIIKPAFSYRVQPGQVLQVTGPDLSGQVVGTGGVPGAVSIASSLPAPFTCGISQSQPNGGPSPICAFPMLAKGLDVIMPLDKVFLMFSPHPDQAGETVPNSHSAGLLIDMTDATGRAVRFDADTGVWSWPGQASWATPYPANTPLAPLLVLFSPTESSVDGPAPSGDGEASSGSERPAGGAAPKEDETTAEGAAPKEDGTPAEGAAAKEDETTAEGAAVKEDETTVEGAAPKEDERTAEGAAAKEDGTTAEGAAAKEDETTAEGAAAKEDGTTVEGAAAKEDETTAEGAAAKEDGTTAEGAAAKEDGTTAEGAAAKEDETTAEGAVPKEDKTPS